MSDSRTFCSEPPASTQNAASSAGTTNPGTGAPSAGVGRVGCGSGNMARSALPGWFTPNSRSCPASVTIASRSPSVTGGNHAQPGTDSSDDASAGTSVGVAPSVGSACAIGNARSFIDVGPSA